MLPDGHVKALNVGIVVPQAGTIVNEPVGLGAAPAVTVKVARAPIHPEVVFWQATEYVYVPAVGITPGNVVVAVPVAPT